MKTLLTKLQQFLVSEDGPTAVEYAVMLALILLVCIASIGVLGTSTKTLFENSVNAMGQAMGF